MSASETQVAIPRPRVPQAFCVRLLRAEEDRLRNEASVAMHRANYARARGLAAAADKVARRIREASGHA